MDILKMPKTTEIHECKICDFKCSKLSNFTKHLATSKHQKNIKWCENDDKKMPKDAEKTTKCECGRVYTHYSGLWRHKKTCTHPQIDDNTLSKLVLEVVKSNSELQKQNEEFKTLMVEQNTKVMDLCEVMKNNTTTTNNTMNNTINSNNKSFNLNVFLNETCKDAMNMKDFVDSIQITLADIENMGKLGFVNGISNIIVNRLKAIDVHLRPVHCTDQRRETMYVKEKNKWNKEEEDNKNIRTFIQLVAHKNTKNLSLFKNKHPDCLEYHSKYNDQYNKIVMETFGGYGNTDYDSENKIIRKLVKELAIDKS